MPRFIQLLPFCLLTLPLLIFSRPGSAAGAGETAPHLPIRLLNLNSFGDTISNWVEPGTTSFAQVHWVHHNLCRYDFRPEGRTEDFLESVAESRARLSALGQRVLDLGMIPYINEFEIDYPEFIARDSLLAPEARERFMEEKVYEIFTQCPWLHGYMITPTEGKLGAANPEEMRAVAMGAYRGTKRAEKELGAKRFFFIRSWLSSAASEREVRRYFPVSTDPEIAKDMIVVAKDGLGDFVMRRPMNPLFGNVRPHSIIALFDVSVSEYRSLGWYPQGPADLWASRIRQLVATPGVIGIQIHTGRLSDVEGFTPEQLYPRFKEDRTVYPFQGGVKWSPWHHLNVYTLFRLLRNPDEPSRVIYEDWARENYAERAAKPMADMLLLADDALYHGTMTFGVCLNNHSSFYFGDGGTGDPIEGMNRALQYMLKLQPELAPLFETSPATADRALQEKELARQLVDQMIEIIESHRDSFAAEDFAGVYRDLLRMRGAIHAYTCAQAGYFAYRVATADPPVPNPDYYRDILEQLIGEAEELTTYEPAFLHRDTKRSFIYLTRAYREGLVKHGSSQAAPDAGPPVALAEPASN